MISRCIVKSLAECGADVAIHYHKNSEKAEELAAELKAMGQVSGGKVMPAI